MPVQQPTILNQANTRSEHSLSISHFLVATISFAASFLFLWGLTDRIDFHADEAIYLANVPISLKNDTGLWFNGWYQVTTGYISTVGSPTPLAARTSSALLGALAIGSIVIAFCMWHPNMPVWKPLLLPITAVVSYQGIFLIIRVRPEISWFALSIITICVWTQVGRNPSKGWITAGLSLLMLLPMNHRLSWLAAALIAIYFLIFGSRTYGWKVTTMALCAIPLGVLVNLALRPIITGETFSNAWIAFLATNDTPPRMQFFAYLRNVFSECSDAFNDRAAYPSLLELAVPRLEDAGINHHAIANWIWAVGCLLPIFAKTWQERYLLSVPFLFLLLLYIAGYFNPTYFAMLSLYSTFALLHLTFSQRQSKWTKGMLALLLMLSIFNGISFLSTRILNHGRATIFTAGREIHSLIKTLPSDASIAIPERLQYAVTEHPGKRYVLYKDVVPENVEYLVIDNYDAEIYRPFVSDFDAKRQQIDLFVKSYQLVRQRTYPVYENELLFSRLRDKPFEILQGSWFFRNSVQYQLTVLARKN